jgi:hypothetical protein
MEWKTDYSTHSNEDSFDFDSLLHPAQAFAHPNDVVNDPDAQREVRDSRILGVGCLRAAATQSKASRYPLTR